MEWKKELIRICKILDEYEIDITKIPVRKNMPNGKRVYTKLGDISIEGINIEKIINDNQLDGGYLIGYYIGEYRSKYNADRNGLSHEECELAEELGIVKKHNESASKPISKGGKATQFHVDFINGMFDKILSGEINTVEARSLLENAAKAKGETVLSSRISIRKIVENLLKDKPDELKRYNNILKVNMGRRNFLRGKGIQPDVGTYNEAEKAYRSLIIDKYLPLYINGSVTMAQIVKETGCSYDLLNKIIKEHCIQNDEIELLEKYEEVKKENSGNARAKRAEGDQKRKEILDYKIVSNSEFLLLPKEEQEKQLIMKVKKNKLKTEQSESAKGKSGLIADKSVKKKLNILMDYFKGKNTKANNYFTDEDVRYMIFRASSIMGRTTDTIEKKIKVLTSYDEINERTAYDIVKRMPGIFEYSDVRTKSQLDLLKKENLIDYVIDHPNQFMKSVSLMYALIQFNKEIHHTSDLSDVSRSSIFMSGIALKRRYGMTYEQLKQKYPFEEKEEDMNYVISDDDLSKATYKARGKSDEAARILNQAINENTKGDN